MTNFGQVGSVGAEEDRRRKGHKKPKPHEGEGRYLEKKKTFTLSCARNCAK